MSSNIFNRLRALFPDAPLLVGTVTAIGDGTATIELPDGGVIQARGAATIGTNVFVRDDVIEAAAPSLSIEVIEV